MTSSLEAELSGDLDPLCASSFELLKKLVDD
jgi:hypothetical protein